MRSLTFLGVGALFLALTCPLPAQNVLSVGDVVTSPGAPFTSTLFLSNDGDVQGFQTAVTFDSSILTLNSMDMSGTDVAAELAPSTVEFFLTNIDNSAAPGVGWGAVAAIFDSSPPFNGQVLLPGVNRSLVNYHFDSLNDPVLIGSCALISLTDGFGPPPGVSNIITVGSTSVQPQLLAGQVCFVDLPTFVRGDANQDQVVNVADSIYVIQYLFDSGAGPVCFDAADANDDENLDISDFIAVLTWQFLGGPPPPAPYPGCGIDTTGPDQLGCLLFPQCGTILTPPTVAAISPANGPSAGGTTVIITGTGLTFDASVFFGTEEAPGVIFVNDTTLEVVTPVSPVIGPVNVQVVTPAGATTLPNGFLYE